MEIQRTANAGVRLTMDGVSILLDGLADAVEGYLPTPPAIVDQIWKNPPDILVYTHNHPDHCSETLLLPYRKQNLRPIYGPESLHTGGIKVGAVTVIPVESRHIGRTEPGLQHVSYIIRGSQCIWFMGDAAPLQWKTRTYLPKPDVLIAPYAYGNTQSAWDFSRNLAKNIVLLHLPDRDKDVYSLWDSVETATVEKGMTNLWIPEIGETIIIP